MDLRKEIDERRAKKVNLLLRRRGINGDPAIVSGYVEYAGESMDYLGDVSLLEDFEDFVDIWTVKNGRS